MSKVITAVDFIKIAGNAALKAKRAYIAIGVEIRNIKNDITDAQREGDYRLVRNLHAALKYRRLELEVAEAYYGDCRDTYNNLCNTKFDLEQKAKLK